MDGRASIVMSVLVLVAAASPPAGAQEAERLVSPTMPGFVIGFSAANDSQSIVEEVPEGETVQAWTRMITTQRFAGLAAQATPADLLGHMAQGMRQACPAGSASAVKSLSLGGHRAARMTASCPGSGGTAESFVALAVAGARDMHVKQAAVRGPGAAAKLGWGDKLLAATVLCGPSDDGTACRRK